MMELCISANELRKALKDVETAEKNGFKYCLTVFKIVSAGRCLDECQAEYEDLWVKAHPTHGMFDWGRSRFVAKTNEFKNGRLIPLF